MSQCFSKSPLSLYFNCLKNQFAPSKFVFFARTNVQIPCLILNPINLLLNNDTSKRILFAMPMMKCNQGEILWSLADNVSDVYHIPSLITVYANVVEVLVTCVIYTYG